MAYFVEKQYLDERPKKTAFRLKNVEYFPTKEVADTLYLNNYYVDDLIPEMFALNTEDIDSFRIFKIICERYTNVERLLANLKDYIVWECLAKNKNLTSALRKKYSEYFEGASNRSIL